MALPAIDKPRNDGPGTVEPRTAPAPGEVVEAATVVAGSGAEWVSCPSCGMDVRAEALERHRATQH